MKILIRIAIILVGALFCATVVVNLLRAQSVPKEGTGSNPIPENVMKAAGKSCVNCHAEPGNPMALSHVNLSNWEKYSAIKQSAKAQAMCKMVTEGKMPPGSFRKEHPDKVPTKEDIKTICDWASSLQTTKK